ncbi:MAG: hypothetical protein WDZ35_09085 [Crocinitomicaceae bacterium]
MKKIINKGIIPDAVCRIREQQQLLMVESLLRSLQHRTNGNS